MHRARPRRRMMALLAAVAVVVAPQLVPTPAAAAPLALGGCVYPYVCVYTANGTKVGQFRDFTSGWQGFSRTDITQAKNTRNDDVVYFRYQSGKTSCVENNRESGLQIDGYGAVTGLQINAGDTCYQGSSPPPV